MITTICIVLLSLLRNVVVIIVVGKMTLRMSW